jgi:hypothetical protein
MITVGNERREVTIEDVEPVADFVRKVGDRTARFGVYEIDVHKTGPLLFGRVVVSRTSIDLFAAMLAALGGEQPELAYLYDQFVETFPGADPGTFRGDPR